MGETLVEWCRRAQDEQIHQELGIIYANYVASDRLGLITEKGYENFRDGLALSPPLDGSGLSAREDRSYGLTAIAIERAKNYLAKESASAPPRDFRLSGKTFAYSDLLVSLLYSSVRPAMAATSASPAPSRRAPPPTTDRESPRRVIWLTKPEFLVEKLRERLAARGLPGMDDVSFFAHIVAMLGLRPPSDRSGNASCQMRAFILKPGATLARPHALSQGYPEKFCAVSPFGQFGATADNRTGSAAMPEALAYLDDLQAIPPTDRLFQGFSSEIQKLVTFGSGDPVTLSGDYPISQLHGDDDPRRGRRVMLERLSDVSPATNSPCSRSAANAICPRFTEALA